ncbi:MULTISPECIES: hypothetical protein [Catenuloplanes]|uniref:ABC transport system permease protein n=1 Tax=Catenuloplanes niger TaxID=587534 RepID=A0AAE3ZIQ3_9ACTN|nr:hypothetical protein [Catenuloplanes niger]MDR7320689.1 putative ABC transport system permease protein [Catenuloplanes niger]
MTAAGPLGALGLLCLLAALLITGLMRAVSERTDVGLVADLPPRVRDLRLVHDSGGGETADVAAAEAQLDGRRASFPEPLPEVLAQGWFGAQAGPAQMSIPVDGDCEPPVTLRFQTGTLTALRWVEGRPPGHPGGEVEAVLSRSAADAIGAEVGWSFTVAGTVPIRIVGIYEPLDAADPVWDDFAVTTVPCADAGTFTHRVTLLTDRSGLAAAASRTGVFRYDWRYRTGDALTAASAPTVTTAVVESRRRPPQGTVLVTGLDTVLADFAARLRAVSALLAVVLAGLATALTGLILLTARLAVDRRRDEFALIRARGGSAAAIAARCLAEVLCVVPLAVGAGWLAGTCVPGRPAAWEVPAVVAVAVLGVAVVPVLSARPVPRHADPLRRAALETFVVLLAALGVFLLRRRGLSQQSGVDWFLAAIPALVAIAAALSAARAIGPVLRLARRATARVRGPVLLLGLGRAAHGRPLVRAPLAVLVVAAATGAFTATVASAVDRARDHHVDLAVGGDSSVHGLAFSAPTAGRLAVLPGVRGVAAASVEAGTRLRIDTPTGTRELVQAQQMVLDGPAAAAVLEAAGVRYTLPAFLTDPAADGSGPVPAVVSPAIAAAVGEGALTDVRGRRFAFRVAAVADTFPGFIPGAREFIVLPWQTVPAEPIANRYLLAGEAADPAALLRVADDGQIGALAVELGRELSPAELPVPSRVVMAGDQRAALSRGGINGVLSLVHAAGAAGGLLLALLAVAVSVTADGVARGRALSRLRTMGMSVSQGRTVLAIELLPLVTAAVSTAAAVGGALPWLVGPALGMAAVTEGLDMPLRADPRLLVALPVLVVATLLFALLVEERLHRARGLGATLRFGDDR